MPRSSPTIAVQDLSKRYGDRIAVEGLSFAVEPGRVTGFLGPNGAGKSTTMRLILGLDRPERGRATIGGRPYRELSRPLCEVGALLETRAVHTGRRAYDHLLCLAQTQSLPRTRVDEVIDLVELGAVARKRAGGLSLGMSQRLGIAAALLGDPRVLILDEPVNGLDPAGVRWIRTLMRDLAAGGRTVFVSSHLMNEMAVTADHLIVIDRGRLVADCATSEFIERHSTDSVRVRTPDSGPFASLVAVAGGSIRRGDNGELVVTGVPAERIGALAATAHLTLYEISPVRATLEEAFLDLLGSDVDYHGRAS